jgi:hypothetical protein
MHSNNRVHNTFRQPIHTTIQYTLPEETRVMITETVNTSVQHKVVITLLRQP